MSDLPDLQWLPRVYDGRTFRLFGYPKWRLPKPESAGFFDGKELFVDYGWRELGAYPTAEEALRALWDILRKKGHYSELHIGSYSADASPRISDLFRVRPS